MAGRFLTHDFFTEKYNKNLIKFTYSFYCFKVEKLGGTKEERNLSCFLFLVVISS